MAEATMPISLRLPDEVIEILKKEARKISYEQDKDVSYVDLVRDAVRQYVGNVAPPDKNLDPIQIKVDIPNTDNIRLLLKDAVKNSLGGQKDSSRPFSQFDALSQNEWLRLWGINLDNPLAIEIGDRIEKYVEQESLARNIFALDDVGTRAVSIYERNIASIIYYVSRRGAVPDMICEGESFLPPTFEIASMPSMRLTDIISRRTDMLNQAVSLGTEALVKEEESNSTNLLTEASKESTIKITGDISLSHLEIAFDKALKMGFTPSNVILNMTDQLKLANEASIRKGNWRFNLTGNLKDDAGHFFTAKLRVIERISQHSTFILASPSELGCFIKRFTPRVLIYPEPSKLRVAAVLWVDIGMFANSSKVVHIDKITASPSSAITPEAAVDLPIRGKVPVVNTEKTVKRRS
jgi:hypothetical protein